MASVELEPHRVHETSLLSLPLDHLLVVGRLAQLINLIFFSSLDYKNSTIFESQNGLC